MPAAQWAAEGWAHNLQWAAEGWAHTCSGQRRAGHTPAVKSRDVQLPWSALVGAMLVSLLLHHFPKEVLWTVFPEAHTGVHSPWMAVDVKAR